MVILKCFIIGGNKMVKEKIIEFAILRDEKGVLQTEIRDEKNIYEVFGFLKIVIKNMEETLLEELQPRDDNDKDLF